MCDLGIGDVFFARQAFSGLGPQREPRGDFGQLAGIPSGKQMRLYAIQSKTTEKFFHIRIRVNAGLEKRFNEHLL